MFRGLPQELFHELLPADGPLVKTLKLADGLLEFP